MIAELRNSLLQEAIQSPNLLSDLAGLETYVSESYNNRSFIELLQNADDAGSSKFLVERYGDYLMVANDGRLFNKKDIESICRSAASNKERGTTIGYRGIGFKSVVNLANEIHLISGDYNITFSKELTKKAVPQASRVPLIRIPHQLSSDVEKKTRGKISALKEDGYTTFFIFSGLTGHSIEEEYSNFQFRSLIFLRHIRYTELNLDNRVTAEIKRSSDTVTLRVGNDITEWKLFSENNICIAFSIKEGTIERLPQQEAMIHAFLPTEDTSGLGVLLNGDFSTDPSRRHLIFDDLTIDTIDHISNLYVNILADNILRKDAESTEIVSAMMPYSDFRMIQFSGNKFGKILSANILEKGQRKFERFLIAPDWLNSTDFVSIVGRKAIPSAKIDNQDIKALSKFLQAKQASLTDLISSYDINSVDISLNGCVQIMAQIVRDELFGKHCPTIKDLKLIVGSNERYSLNELQSSNQSVDSAYIELLSDVGITENDFISFLKKENLMSLANDINEKRTSVLSENTISKEEFNESDEVYEWFSRCGELQEDFEEEDSISRWRSSEEKALEFFNRNGFNLRDVSKQNLGYDLYGTDPDGNEACIEVKSIIHNGDSFSLTNNEYAVAQLKGDCFYIALLNQMMDSIEIGLIKNPAANLELERRAVQWVWDCHSYNCNKIKIKAK